jgi:hypothetical protein
MRVPASRGLAGAGGDCVIAAGMTGCWLLSNRRSSDSLMGWVARISIISCWPPGIRARGCFPYLSGPHLSILSDCSTNRFSTNGNSIMPRRSSSTGACCIKRTRTLSPLNRLLKHLGPKISNKYAVQPKGHDCPDANKSDLRLHSAPIETAMEARNASATAGAAIETKRRRQLRAHRRSDRVRHEIRADRRSSIG